MCCLPHEWEKGISQVQGEVGQKVLLEINLILKIDYRVIKDDHIKIFSNYDSNNLIPSLHFPAHGNLSPHSIPYFLQLHLKS